MDCIQLALGWQILAVIRVICEAERSIIFSLFFEFVIGVWAEEKFKKLFYSVSLLFEMVRIFAPDRSP